MQSDPATRNRRLKKRWVVVAIVLLVVSWVGYDLYGPRSTDIRSFDPDEVARLETAMWRSYYAKERVSLFNKLSETLRIQYRLPLVRSNTVAYQAAKAAFVFKEGHNRADYEKALPYLINFYTEINKVSQTKFDVDKVARLEVEWWIIHRERAKHAPGDLDLALAELPAEIYHVPVQNLMEHAHLRAVAMTIRDDKADAGGVTEDDWRHIEELLHQSYKSLFKAINN
ncbi:MAG TPA: hypothetical protein VFC63_26805 [Blastocatellia bacterium]|nr:hypothetical protein [Blastocatellia bacterium]